MKKSILFIAVALFSTIIFTNCNKEGLIISEPIVPTFLESILNAHTCIEDDYNGNIVIQSYKTIHTQQIGTAKISGQFYGTDELENKGNFKIGNIISIAANDQNRYESKTSIDDLDGGTKVISLGDTNNTFFSESFTFPKMVKMIYPSIHDDFIIEAESNPITWEVDPNNNIGVAIIIEYLPDYLGNDVFSSQGYDKIVLNTKIIPDNGSYSFESSDFDNIPDGALITARIARIGCDSIEDKVTGGQYLIYVATVVDAVGKYMGGLN